MSFGESEKVSRRNFIRNSVAASAMAGGGVWAEDASYAALRGELESILDLAGFDRMSGTGAVVGIFSDPHILVGWEYPTLVTQVWEDDLINELNALHPPITHLVLAGDLISHRSMTPGSPRYPSHVTRAEEEYAYAQVEVGRFQAPMWMIPGNHDTDAFEENAEMFQEKMGSPPYQAIELGGVPIIMLNTGNAGMLDAVQEAWLREQAMGIPGDQEVLIVQHIPTFATVYTQAGSKRIIADAFQGRSAPVFIASGHNHRFGESLSSHGGTLFLQMITTTASRVVFNDKKNPGYMILGLQDGRVKVRVQRSLTAIGFWARPGISDLPVSQVRFPFDEIPYVLASYEEGFYETGQ